MFLVASEIILQLTDLLENETNDIQFVCQAIGVPVPYIRWYFNGVMVNLSDSSKYNSSSIYLNESVIESTLDIMNAESSDVGAYTCEAENVLGTDQSSGVLTVNGKYECVYVWIETKHWCFSWNYLTLPRYNYRCCWDPWTISRYNRAHWGRRKYYT